MNSYQKLILFAFLFLACSSSWIKQNKKIEQNINNNLIEDISAVPKLPMYLGSSYNLINGNPKS